MAAPVAAAHNAIDEIPHPPGNKYVAAGTMSESEEVKFSVRVVMNKEENKVLFAEADSSFADVLLSFLTLPLGTIVRLLLKHYANEAPIVGSLSTLYQGEQNSRYYHYDNAYVSIYKYVEKCDCGKPLNTEISLETVASNDVEVFTKEKASFLIANDLQLLPNLPGSSIKILKNLGMRDIKVLKERTILVGSKEIMNLLKGSLVSRDPLTYLVLDTSQLISTTVKSSDLGASLDKVAAVVSSKKMIVKAIIQKTTNRVLVAQAQEDFVDFLFSLLSLPLAKVLCLLDGNTSLSSVDNLYNSISNLDGGRYLKTQGLEPMQAISEYFCKNSIFPRTRHSLRCFTHRHEGSDLITSYLAFHPPARGHYFKSQDTLFRDMDGKEGYVKGPSMFMVSDDLVVTPCAAAISSLSILNNLNIELADVEELTFEIGKQEALSILKASLTSASALTNSLKPFIERQLEKVKQEK
ncbi:UNVERIFIED_CONTAM: hypothetical protein Slati_3285300 [Sesamum latifolium]|uniref:DUF674 family protein n=1 Tax=Sesamum latifolium TaxID=2727402 RepID=A0AAW2V1C4_9LAMI